ncbi:MAG TPA: flagellar hook-basal body complex protein [Alphaproteobacteria bacterium]|nr:flagellar hook-basal body complex protein [Alphaproteobacteria bacterium]
MTFRPIGLQIGLGAKVVGAYRSFAKGDLINTGNPLNIAIDGQGFFQVQMPDGTTAYTRSSSFQLSADGTIVTTDGGFKVLPGIVIPANAQAVEINEVGQVYITYNGQTSSVLLGQFELATFLNPSGLKVLRGGFFSETAASGTPTTGYPNSDNRGGLLQGFREGSNVNSVQEITDLIKIEKGFGFLTKVLNTADAMSDSMKGIGRN